MFVYALKDNLIFQQQKTLTRFICSKLKPSMEKETLIFPGQA